MELKERIDLCLRLQDRIYFFWNWYIVGLIAIVGWILTTDNVCSPHFKVILSFAFLTFIGMNISGLLRAYKLFGAARRDLLRQYNLTRLQEFSANSICSVIEKQTYNYSLLTLVYAIGVVAVLLIIWGKGKYL